jgi:hypothetical protein
MAKRRMVAAWTRAEVWRRDGGRCTHRSGGDRCGVTRDLVVSRTSDGPAYLDWEPRHYALLCHPHAALWALNVPEQDWAHA